KRSIFSTPATASMPSAWGTQPQSQSTAGLSLADIQRLQEQKEREEAELREQIKRQNEAAAQAARAQSSASVLQLSWASNSVTNNSAPKSLQEIQQEEAARLEKLRRQQEAARQRIAPVARQAFGSAWSSSAPTQRHGFGGPMNNFEYL